MGGRDEYSTEQYRALLWQREEHPCFYSQG